MIDRTRREPDFYLDWKVRLFFTGAVLVAAGVVFGQDVLVLIAIILLVVGLLATTILNRRRKRAEATMAAEGDGDGEDWDADDRDEETLSPGSGRRRFLGALSPDRPFARSSQRRSTPPPTSGEGLFAWALSWSRLPEPPEEQGRVCLLHERRGNPNPSPEVGGGVAASREERAAKRRGRGPEGRAASSPSHPHTLTPSHPHTLTVFSTCSTFSID